VNCSNKIEAAFFDLAGASRYLGGALGVRSLRRLIAKPGGLPHYRLGRGKLMIRRADLDALLERHRHEPLDLDALVDKVVEKFGPGGKK
jgi:hypothetical protein